MIVDKAASDPKDSRLISFRLLKVFVWFQERLQPSELQITLVWAGMIGFCGAVSSIVFRVATDLLRQAFTANGSGGVVESFAQLSPLLRLTIPALGGLIAGLIIHFGVNWKSSVPTTDYMEAVVLGDGKISARRSLIKSLSSLFTISSGGSIGREGPLVQLSSLVASLAGRWRALVDTPSAPVGRLRGRGRHCFGLQRAHRRRSFRCRNRSRFRGHGDFRSAGFLFRRGHTDGPRISRRRSALRDPVIPVEHQLGNHSLSFPRNCRRPDCAHGTSGSCARANTWPRAFTPRSISRCASAD